MANAKKCDRCGNFYDLYRGVRVKREGRLYSVTCARLAGSQTDTVFDLCPSCAKAIAIFFGVKVVEDKGSEEE